MILTNKEIHSIRIPNSDRAFDVPGPICIVSRNRWRDIEPNISSIVLSDHYHGLYFIGIKLGTRWNGKDPPLGIYLDVSIDWHLSIIESYILKGM